MELKTYLKKLYDSRYFWSHLARIELKNKFRRSKLGILWTFVSPLCLTMIMSVVFATAFHQDIATYAPYILSGILGWELITSSFSAGSYVILANASYIRQFNHPLSIYSLKSALVYTITFGIALMSLILWMLFIHPLNILLGILTLPLTLVIYFAIAWSGTTISSLFGTKYGDYPQLVPLILQTLWYVSPVFLQKSLFESMEILRIWFNINPITHFLELVRAPFLYGQLPTLENYLFSIGLAAVLAVFAVYLTKKSGKDIIFYI